MMRDVKGREAVYFGRGNMWKLCFPVTLATNLKKLYKLKSINFLKKKNNY